MAELHERAQALRYEIMNAMEDYCKGRNVAWLVGQFVDDEGRQHQHNGVYGVAAWLNITGRWFSESARQAAGRWDDQLTTACKEALKSWVAQTKDEGKVCEKDSAAHELRHIIPKICAAHDALRFVDGSEDAVTILRRYVNSCEGDGWGFQVSESPHPISTAQVLRSFHGDIHPTRKTHACIAPL